MVLYKLNIALKFIKNGDEMKETIRFIFLGEQINKGKSQFAWYDMESMEGEFLHFDGRQVWDSWDEFEADFWSVVDYLGEEEGLPKSVKVNRDYLARLRKLYQQGMKCQKKNLNGK